MSPRSSVSSGLRALTSRVWRAGRGRAIRALLLALLAGAAEFAGLALLFPLLSLIGLDTGIAPPGGIGLPAVLAAFVVLVGAAALLERAHGLAAARLAVDTGLHLRRRLYAALSGSSWPWFSRLRATDASHVLSEEAERAGSAAQALFAAAAEGVLALVYLALALAAAPGLAGAAAATGLLGLLAWFRIREARWWGAEVSRANRGLLSAVGEGMQDARTDRAEGREEAGVGRFGRAAREAARNRLSLFGHLAGSRALVTTGAAAVLAVFVYLSVAVLATPPAALLLSLLLLNRFLHRALAVVRQVEYAAADLPGFLSVERLTRAALAAAEPRTAAAAPHPVRSGIRLEGVSFSYGGPDRPGAVRDLDLALPAGGLVVITGPTGAGKTTLLDLVAGVLVPDRGRILADGLPLVASVGYVAEDALLLHGTVRSNLLRARPAATEGEILGALAAAGGGDPDRQVGERGQAISGGERRRIALARALLRRPTLLLLDGVADGLDPEEERRLLDSLDRLRGSVTILLVARSREAALRADLVVPLDLGRVPVVMETPA